MDNLFRSLFMTACIVLLFNTAFSQDMFDTKVDYAVGDGAYSVFSIDFNNDGNNDGCCFD